jgi:hypothetical protein
VLWWVCSLQACACTRGLGSRVGRRHSAHALALCAAYPARCRRRHRDICNWELHWRTMWLHVHSAVKGAPPRVFGKRSWAARTDGAGLATRKRWSTARGRRLGWRCVHRDAARAPGRIQPRGGHHQARAATLTSNPLQTQGLYRANTQHSENTYFTHRRNTFERPQVLWYLVIAAAGSGRSWGGSGRPGGGWRDPG